MRTEWPSPRRSDARTIPVTRLHDVVDQRHRGHVLGRLSCKVMVVQVTVLDWGALRPSFEFG
jgi:hypothetical protein